MLHQISTLRACARKDTKRKTRLFVSCKDKGWPYWRILTLSVSYTLFEHAFCHITYPYLGTYHAKTYGGGRSAGLHYACLLKRVDRWTLILSTPWTTNHGSLLAQNLWGRAMHASSLLTRFILWLQLVTGYIGLRVTKTCTPNKGILSNWFDYVTVKYG